MSQTLTSRVEAIKNTPGTGELAQIAEINSAFDKFDNHFIPACKIENTAVQSIPNGGVQLLQYNTTIFDSYSTRPEGAMADLANDRIVIRRDGLYTVRARIWTTTPSATGLMAIGIYKNGAGQAMEQMVPTNAVITQSIEETMDLANGDFMTVNVIQTSGAARNYARNTWPDGFVFSAIWAGTKVEV